ncbi:SDR family oxidoreductase [Parapedobacter indicus]|uniref:NAD(P)-dependent dehydrogenase, short-chain alcohol dehydrogenase family n=1 Tax=Parapedobacter indicus TaxID=1477437 RepID=A0A1I3GTK0_9SPHI|nr:SDR family oxidoreductase [Parapedobacter indicus]PPL02777.1 NAD(P)-dependent dehydrogenase (short-subunit alcohol dehydrogenase family) [Parapedobacter indicus]SFI26764.1 NAD(P)-dependent dehydrogenase, short-chain alcohol dehydrogenase family [Parapedobacter indicus]
MNVKELLSLKNKVIVVTGGSGQYGKCMVEGLAEADATVITTSRNRQRAADTAESFRQVGYDVHGMVVDQAVPDSVDALKRQITERFGRLDGFVNNAVSRPMKGYGAPLEQFDQSMRDNATGMFHLLREMTDLITRSGGGSVINIASMMGMKGPDLSNYEGTNMGDLPPDYFFHNAGLINLTRYMAKMHVGKNVRFNCISPGGLFNNQPEQFLKNYCKKVPLGRMANLDDIKGLVVLLASEAGAYINGENILMDGGLNA